MRNRNLTMGEMAQFMAEEGYGYAEFARKKRANKTKRSRKRGRGGGSALRNAALVTGGLAGATYLGRTGVSGVKGYMSKRAARKAGAMAAGKRMSTPSSQRLLSPSANYSPDNLVNRAGQRVRRK